MDTHMCLSVGMIVTEGLKARCTVYLTPIAIANLIPLTFAEAERARKRVGNK